MLITTCPKCAYQRLPTDTHVHEGVCPACGIAYQKFLDRQCQPTPEPTIVLQATPVEHWTAPLLAPPSQVDAVAFWPRAIAWCAFALWTVWFAKNGIDWELIGGSFLHLIILPFHEFGHLLFMPFGRFMHILGGSLFQVLMPLGLLAVFLFKQRDTFGASVMLWWAGQSLVDLSPYVADAVYRVVPLVGGADEEGHDWGNLLTMMDLLDHTLALARLCFGAGVLVMLAALAWGVLLLRLQYAKMQSTKHGTD